MWHTLAASTLIASQSYNLQDQDQQYVQYTMLKLVLLCYLFTSTIWSSFVQAVHSGDQCHPWSFYNDTLQDCQCNKSPDLDYNHRTRLDFMVQCSERKVLMNIEYCMTNEEAGTFISKCQLYSFNQNATLVDGIYVQLPENISELNDYMCGPMNRKGRVCSECIDGFAPSFTSFSLECSNCTDVWYGVPLYLFLEIVPVTLFYLVVLFMQISVSSSPLTYCVMYSQLAAFYFMLLLPKRLFLKSTIYGIFCKLLITFHGIYNLDFFRHILPPLCISPNLKSIHIICLTYISALFPLMLIALTWLSIEMYSHNFRPLVWLWNKLSFLKTKQDSKTTIIDIFSTFFLLSYTKLCLTSMMFFKTSTIYKANSTQSQIVLGLNPSIHFFSKEHIPYAVIGALLLLVFGVLPALLLAVYPIRRLRCLLLIDCLSGRSKAALGIFVEKFYSCYRDGLDGGRDMRSFASLNLFIRLLLPFVNIFTCSTLFSGGCCILILLVRPCKKACMNNIDAIILALLTLNCFQIDKVHINSINSEFYRYSLLGTAYIPLLITCAKLIPQKCLKKLWRKHPKFLTCVIFFCFKNKETHVRELSDSRVDSDQHSEGDESDVLLPNPIRQLEPGHV